MVGWEKKRMFLIKFHVARDCLSWPFKPICCASEHYISIPRCQHNWHLRHVLCESYLNIITNMFQYYSMIHNMGFLKPFTLQYRELCQTFILTWKMIMLMYIGLNAKWIVTVPPCHEQTAVLSKCTPLTNYAHSGNWIQR